jgi:hypothetical protein
MAARIGARFLVVMAVLTAFGVVVAPGASAATTCDSPTPLNGVTFSGSVQVPPGGHCNLADSTIAGSVSVGAGGYFQVVRTPIGGSVTGTNPQAIVLEVVPGGNVGGGVSVTGATAVLICGAGTIGGPVSLQNAPANGATLLGEGNVVAGTTSLACRHSPPETTHFAGSITIANYGAVTQFKVLGNAVTGNVAATNNTSPGSQIINNTIGGNLTCANNVPPVIATGNTVSGKNTC